MAEHVKEMEEDTMTKLQDVIVQEMKVKKSIDSAEEIAELKQFIKKLCPITFIY